MDEFLLLNCERKIFIWEAMFCFQIRIILYTRLSRGREEQSKRERDRKKTKEREREIVNL